MYLFHLLFLGAILFLKIWIRFKFTSKNNFNEEYIDIFINI